MLVVAVAALVPHKVRSVAEDSNLYSRHLRLAVAEDSNLHNRHLRLVMEEEGRNHPIHLAVDHLLKQPMHSVPHRQRNHIMHLVEPH